MSTMRALVISGPSQASVKEVAVPRAGPRQVVVDVHRVGVCGTDLELFTGEMAYFAQGRASYPLRPGHEWSGRVSELGPGVEPAWAGARVTGDTMLRCGACDRCRSGRAHVCRDLVEVGISRGFAGALAEKIVVPADSLYRLPDSVDDQAGALVEPGGNAWRAVTAAQARPGLRLLVWGPGTIGLLAVGFARAEGAEVHVLGRSRPRLDLALKLGAAGAWTRDELPDVPFDAIIDATDHPSVPAAALKLVEPAGRVVYVGLAGSPSTIDTRDLVLKDVTAVGILSGSPGLAPAIAHYADASVDPRLLVSATLGLERAPEVLAGWHPGTPGPKLQIDPRS